MPESVGILSECASIANKKNLESLTNARKARNHAKTRAKSLIDDLVPVEHFVEMFLLDKYGYETVPSIEDGQLRDQIQKVMNSLREL